MSPYEKQQFEKREKLTTPEDFYPILAPIIEDLFEKGEISFQTLPVKSVPNGWVPKDPDFQYDELLELMKTDEEKAVEISKRICLEYQKVIQELMQERGKDELESLLKDGKNWSFKVLKKWGETLVKSHELKFDINDLVQIEKELREKIKEKGKDFFGYFEGNVIGDHIFVEKETDKIYLAGMRIVPRIGKNYYDFIRSLDWMFLKTPSNEAQFNRIVEYMRTFSQDHNIDWKEMKLVAKTRFIGIGWDMLDPSRGDLGAGDTKEKLKYLEKFIKGEY